MSEIFFLTLLVLLRCFDITESNLVDPRKFENSSITLYFKRLEVFKVTFIHMPRHHTAG